MKEKYYIELTERYDGRHYPKYIKLEGTYLTIEDARAACNVWRNANPNSNFYPSIMAIMDREELNANLAILLK